MKDFRINLNGKVIRSFSDYGIAINYYNKLCAALVSFDDIIELWFQKHCLYSNLFPL